MISSMKERVEQYADFVRSEIWEETDDSFCILVSSEYDRPKRQPEKVKLHLANYDQFPRIKYRG